MQIKKFSKLVGALAFLFGKVKASEDSGVVVVVAFWLGHYFVLAETHLTSRAADAPPEKPLRGMVWQSDEELPTGV